VKRLLLDTHVLLWWLSADNSLGTEAKHLISSGDNVAYVSAASIWEISIKRALGKLKAPADFAAILETEGFDQLPIDVFHAEQAGDLPLLHRDPFDRMLVAQAQAEGLNIITADARIKQYGVRVIDATH
jgi:PIN domain nuclease of toxin-antitoxin system